MASGVDDVNYWDVIKLTCVARRRNRQLHSDICRRPDARRHARMLYILHCRCDVAMARPVAVSARGDDASVVVITTTTSHLPVT